MPPRGISLAKLVRRNARFSRAGTVKMELYLVLFAVDLNRISPSPQAFQGSVNCSLGGNAEVLEKVLGRRAGAKAVHAYEFTIRPDHGIPAPAHGGLDRDLHR